MNTTPMGVRVTHEVWEQRGGFNPTLALSGLTREQAIQQAEELQGNCNMYARPEAMRHKFFVVEATTHRVMVNTDEAQDGPPESDPLGMSKAHRPVNWFTRNTWVSCSCGFAPKNNTKLHEHWQGLGFTWVDHRGALVVRLVEVES